MTECWRLVDAACEELAAFYQGEDGGREAGIFFVEAGLHQFNQAGVGGEDGAAESVAEQFA